MGFNSTGQVEGRGALKAISLALPSPTEGT